MDQLADSFRVLILQKVFDIIHPPRRNLTAIRGYVRIGGYDDDPRTDPQDRSWFGPHDRLFVPEESKELEFTPGPEYGTSKSTRRRLTDGTTCKSGRDSTGIGFKAWLNL